MAKTMKMAVLTDTEGRILGLAHLGEADGEFAVGIKPLPGQAVREVEVPDDVFRSKSPHEVHQWAEHLYVAAGEAPRMRPIRELLEHEGRADPNDHEDGP